MGVRPSSAAMARDKSATAINIEAAAIAATAPSESVLSPTSEEREKVHRTLCNFILLVERILT